MNECPAFLFLLQAHCAEHPAGGHGARADGDPGGQDGDGQGGRRRGAGLRRRRAPHPQIHVSRKDFALKLCRLANLN